LQIAFSTLATSGAFVKMAETKAHKVIKFKNKATAATRHGKTLRAKIRPVFEKTDYEYNPQQVSYCLVI